MEQESKDKSRRMSLPVLSSSGKVEELRRELAAMTEQSIIPPEKPQPQIDRPAQLKALEEKIIAALRLVFDPEIPVNIYELGLIYAIDIKDDNAVTIRMTLTAPACPVAGQLVADVQRRVAQVVEATSATVELVWEPPWNPAMMSEAAKLELGMF